MDHFEEDISATSVLIKPKVQNKGLAHFSHYSKTFLVDIMLGGVKATLFLRFFLRVSIVRHSLLCIMLFCRYILLLNEASKHAPRNYAATRSATPAAVDRTQIILTLVTRFITLELCDITANIKVLKGFKRRLFAVHHVYMKFPRNRHHVKHGCRSDASEQVAGDISYVPPSAYTAVSPCR
eukprot:6194819-Pleurochrysis_carterae.AAC.2